METRFLETFVLVAELGSLAEASRRLGITPVAVAQRMQALEDEVGAQLLIRAGRRVKPTQAGYAILEKGRFPASPSSTTSPAISVSAQSPRR
jgi:DNA-binding transcriptional LysR family regulator